MPEPVNSDTLRNGVDLSQLPPLVLEEIAKGNLNRATHVLLMNWNITQVEAELIVRMFSEENKRKTAKPTEPLTVVKWICVGLVGLGLVIGLIVYLVP